MSIYFDPSLNPFSNPAPKLHIFSDNFMAPQYIPSIFYHAEAMLIPEAKGSGSVANLHLEIVYWLIL